ncbi:hypothetical protein ACFSUS_24800 [Spirosoma soli]|uniref:Uncharacterized protein n=1 Tax=Spirosoma soli TaxID=1770529 RepID=A0ABW5MB31_9BACT
MSYPQFHFFVRSSCAAIVTCVIVVGTLLAQPRIAAPVKKSRVLSNARQAAVQSGLQTIENNQIRVGINTNYGGAITYLAFKDTRNGNVRTENIVNNYDLGRQVQIGIYSGPEDYSRRGAEAWVGLGWNPIQAGDVYGNPAKVLTVEKQQNLLYVKSIPTQFAINNEPGEVTIEHWIRLENNVVKVHAKIVMFRSDKRQFTARQQEFPCIYANGEYHNIWYYRRGKPYSNDDLDLARPPMDYGEVLPTEPWMASVNDKGYGVGLYVPGVYEWKKGYFGTEYAGDEFSAESAYIGATNSVLLDHNMTYEWDYELVLGHITEIRSHVYSKPHPLTGPNYRFDTSRKGWFYYNAQDTGWPISGKLHVKLDNARENQIKSPYAFWKGRDNPKLYVRAAFNTQNNQFRLGWRRAEDKTLYGTGDRLVNFPIINDGQFHTYEIDLSRNENWLNYNIGQLVFRPIEDGPPINGWAEFEWISTQKDGPVAEAVDPEDPIEVACEPGCSPVTAQRIRYIPGNRKQ